MLRLSLLLLRLLLRLFLLIEEESASDHAKGDIRSKAELRIQVPGFGVLAFYGGPKPIFVAECGYGPHKRVLPSDLRCKVQRQAWKGRKCGSGFPLGFLMCWLRSQGSYTTRAAHCHDEFFEPTVEERREARSDLLRLPGGLELQRKEPWGPDEIPAEPAHFTV